MYVGLFIRQMLMVVSIHYQANMPVFLMRLADIISSLLYSVDGYQASKQKQLLFLLLVFCMYYSRYQEKEAKEKEETGGKKPQGFALFFFWLYPRSFIACRSFCTHPIWKTEQIDNCTQRARRKKQCMSVVSYRITT